MGEIRRKLRLLLARLPLLRINSFHTIIFLRTIFFICLERDTHRESVCKCVHSGGAEGEGDPMPSAEPDVGLDLTTLRS